MRSSEGVSSSELDGFLQGYVQRSLYLPPSLHAGVGCCHLDEGGWGFHVARLHLPHSLMLCGHTQLVKLRGHVYFGCS